MFSVPLSVRLPCPGITRRTALWSSDFPPTRHFARQPCCPAVARGGDRLACLRPASPPPSAVRFLADPILLELLVEVAPGRIDQLGRLRDVPSRLTQLLHEERPFGGLLVLAQRGGLH